MKSVMPLLRVADIAASLAFYRDVLGFTVTSEMPDADGRLMHGHVQHGAADFMFGPIDAEFADAGVPLGAGVMFYVGVDDPADLDPFFQHVKATGATVIQEPTKQFWGQRDWGILDPDGNQLYFYAATAGATAGAESGQLAGATAG